MNVWCLENSGERSFTVHAGNQSTYPGEVALAASQGSKGSSILGPAHPHFIYSARESLRASTKCRAPLGSRTGT